MNDGPRARHHHKPVFKEKIVPLHNAETYSTNDLVIPMIGIHMTANLYNKLMVFKSLYIRF